MQTGKTDMIVIGAGPAGLFTVFQAGMLGMRCVVIDALPEIGGQCAALYPEKPIYDIPSRPVVSGADLITELQAQAAPFKPEYRLGRQVSRLTETTAPQGWCVETADGGVYEAKTVVIAAGAGAFVPNRPPLDGIESYEGRSVFYSIRDIKALSGKRVVIAGGGDSAVDWALALADKAQSVTVVHRRDSFRALPESVALLKRLAAERPDSIRIMTPYQLTNLAGDDGRLESVSMETLDGECEIIPADCLLPLYGMKSDLGPIAEWGLCAPGARGIPVDPSTCETARKGLFAVGDIATYDKKLKLILTGFAEAASACHHAYSYVYPDKPLHFEYSTTRGVKAV